MAIDVIFVLSVETSLIGLDSGILCWWIIIAIITAFIQA